MTLQIPSRRQSLTASITRPSREKSENRHDDILWLDKNENMDPTYLNFIQTLITNLPGKALFGYPDCHALYQKLSAYLTMPINELFIAAGSDGVIRTVFDVFVNPGDTVIYTDPTFAMYELYAQMHGAHALPLHYRFSNNGPLLTVDDVVNAITSSQPKLVCLPNPNSPSGTIFHPDELRYIIKTACDAGAVILIDEAYYPFYPETVAPLVNEFSGLIVARSFSKAWGCAGIRMGYGVARKEIIQELHKVRPMYEAGALSFTIAERLLDYPDEMLNSVRRLNEGKKYFLAEMKKLGMRTLVTEGNFLHVAFDEHAAMVHDVLKNTVLYRQNFNHPSLAGYSRFSATTRERFAPLVTQIQDAVIKITME
jgi:histidinol-phosphate aminotransferase